MCHHSWLLGISPLSALEIGALGCKQLQFLGRTEEISSDMRCILNHNSNRRLLHHQMNLCLLIVFLPTDIIYVSFLCSAQTLLCVFVCPSAGETTNNQHLWQSSRRPHVHAQPTIRWLTDNMFTHRCSRLLDWHSVCLHLHNTSAFSRSADEVPVSDKNNEWGRREEFIPSDRWTASLTRTVSSYIHWECALFRHL